MNTPTKHTDSTHVMLSALFKNMLQYDGSKKTYDYFKETFDSESQMLMLIRKYHPEYIETRFIGNKDEPYFQNEDEMEYKTPTFQDLSESEKRMMWNGIKQDVLNVSQNHMHNAWISSPFNEGDEPMDKLKVKLKGNHEYGTLYEDIMKLNYVQECTVVYDGECQTIMFISL